MAKELRPSPELYSCEVCARTILKGERIEPFLVPGGQRRLVCELCASRAEASGWIRESAHAEQPASHAPEPRASLFQRMGRRWRADRARANGAGAADRADDGLADPEADAELRGDGRGELDVESRPAPEPPRPAADEASGRSSRGLRRRAAPASSARHVRAVPTNAQVKVERALEVFNASQHRRTVAGLARTLGPPWVSAAPETDSPSYVTIVVAWELSWYRYTVDLGDADDPVSLAEKGHELDELDDTDRDWNGAVDPEGGLVAGVGA